MWGFSSTIPKIRLGKVSTEPNLAYSEFSDDDVSSNPSREEGLECPICYESFNIVENVPYVLWCGHTLCRNCVLGLQCSVIELPAQTVKIPFFVTCPWCNLLSFRFSYKGNLKFPRKNYFLLWMIESLNGERSKSSFFSDQNLESLTSGGSAERGTRTGVGERRVGEWDYQANGPGLRRPQFLLHKSLDYFINIIAKFPLVAILLLILLLVIPGSAAILVLYLMVTLLVAVPAVLVLYFAYPIIEWLVREITG